MRTRWLILSLCLLCLAGAWLLWSRSAKTQTKLSAPPNIAASTAPAAFAILATNAVKNGKVVSRANPFAWRLSNTSKTIGQLAGDSHAILLENALIDSSQPLNLSLPKDLQSPGDPGAYIVQARSPIDNTFRALLASAGAQVVSYIPNDAYLVRIGKGGADGLAGNSLVQAVIPYEPYYKVQSSLMRWLGQSLPDGATLNLGLFPGGEQQAISDIKNAGGQIVTRDRDIVRVVPPKDWTALARLPVIHVVEPYHERVHANDLSRANTSVASDSVVSSNYMNLTGLNVRVQVNDSGIDALHPDLAGRVFGAPLTDTEGHGTHVAGIIAGDGTESITVTNASGSILTNNFHGSPKQFRGKAPAAKLFAMDFNDPDQDLQEAAAQTNALISNNSWNFVGDTAYDLAAASYDAAVRDALPLLTGSQPVLFVFAAGNNGDGDDGNDPGSGTADTVESPGTAKNVVTVGAIQQLRNITNQVMTIDANGVTNFTAPWAAETSTRTRVAGFSSRGNVGIGTEGAFGRFKPDVVAPGTFVISTRSEQWDTANYFLFNPTNHDLLNFSVVVGANGIGGSQFPLVPTNAVGVSILTLPNGDSPVPFPNLPIYVGLMTTVGFDFVMNGSVTIPPDGGPGYLASIFATESIRGFRFAISNNLSQPINFDLILDTITTNNNNSFVLTLSNLNNSIGEFNPGNTVAGPYYRYESGTSMSAGDVSGVLALIQDYFTNTLKSTPSPALLKALLINGARTTGFYDLQVQNTINYEGWGLVQLTNTLPQGVTTNPAAAGESALMLDQSPANALATGDQHTFLVSVADPIAQTQPLRVTLVWTDPPGDPAAAIKLVNNLDLVVTNLDNDPTNPIVYYGNDIGSGTAFNTPRGTNASSADVVNNVENVYISPLPGTNFYVTVIGRGVNVNAVTAHTNNVVQDFALVISSGNGDVTNAFTVTDLGVSSAASPAGQTTFVVSTNAPLLNQFVGASTPLLGTNTQAIGTNTMWGTNGVLTLGVTNQWHFYVITNTGSGADFTNAAFITFLPPTLSIPRMGVFAGSTENATRQEADIDLYVAGPNDPNASGLTNLDPVVISNCLAGAFGDAASLGRGGTEFVTYTNSVSITANPGAPSVYYVGVYSEDQEASEYGFIPIFTDIPFGSPGPNGGQVVNGLNVPVDIPDGSTAHPGRAFVFAISLSPTQVKRVVVTNAITHENVGDLMSTLTHSSQNSGRSQSIVMNNHDSLFNPSGFYSFIFDDSGQGDIGGSRLTDGPGSLNQFIGKDGLGVWMLTEIDTSLTQTGSVTGFNLLIEPHQDLSKGVTATLGPLGWFYDFIDVPAGVTNLSLFATNLTGTGLVGMFVRLGAQPTLTNFDFVAFLTNSTPPDPPGNSISIGPPIAPGRYFVGLYNASLLPQTVYIIATLNSAIPPGQSIFTSGSAVPIFDDAVTYATNFVTRDQALASVDVGLRVDHQRVSDLVFHLISPDGTRCLLVENRGGTTTNGMGETLAFTNVIPASSSGGAAPETNVISVIQPNSTLPISYNFFQAPDEMIVLDSGNNLIFDSGLISGSGVFTITYTNSSALTIVVNPNGNPDPSTAWDYTVNSAQAFNSYLVLTEDTSKTTTPIKYAVPPFHGTATLTTVTNPVRVTLQVPVTNSVVVTNTTVTVVPVVVGMTGMSDGFENEAQQFAVPAGNFVSGWEVVNGDVDVFNPTPGHLATADTGTNCLDLNGFDPGTIATNFTTIVGQQYVLTFAYTKNPSPANPGYPFFVASANIDITGQPTYQLDTPATMLNSYDDLNWQYATIVFTATSTTTTLQFSSLNPGSGGMFLDSVSVKECPFFNGFEGAAAGDYVSGNTFDTWIVNTNQVTVITDATLANPKGINLLALADGAISNTLPTFAGGNYTLRFACRGPSAVSLWRGANDSTDAVDGNDGANVGAVTYVPGAVGQAFDFDGNFSGVELGAAPNLALQTFTIDAWVRRHSSTQATLDVAHPDNGSFLCYNTDGYLFGPKNDGTLILGQVGVSSVTSSALILTDITSFHHVAVTKTGGTVIFYLDGVPETVAPYNPTFTFASTVAIGARGGDQAASFFGSIDELSVYDRPLSGSEIKAIFNHGTAGKYDVAAPFIAQGLAKAQLTAGSNSPAAFFGSNTNWHIQTLTFTATQTNTPLQLAGLEPGMLLDNVALLQLPATNFVLVTNIVYSTNYATNGFEGATAGDYPQGQVFDGWVETTNQVTVITDTNLAPEGSNLLALADGQVSRVLPTVAGVTYNLSFAYRGPGAAALWRAQNNTNDSVNGNDAVAVNNINYVAGEVGQAFQFDGSTSLITVPASPSLAVSNVTLEAWIFPTDLNTIRPIFDYGGAGQEAAISLWLNTEDGLSLNPGGLHALIRGPIVTSPALEVDTFNTPVRLNQWNHVAFTGDLKTLTGILYCNGIQVAVNTASIPVIPPSFEPVNLGYRDVGSVEALAGTVFQGILDEASIYNRPLSGSEIKAIYNHGFTGKYDLAAPTIASGLAEAQITLGGSNMPAFFADNDIWQTTNLTFTAASNNTVLKITGIEPGMLLDNFILTQLAVTVTNVLGTNASGGDVYYLPEESLDTFQGKNAQGPWQLEVWDNRVGAGLTNTLVSWQLRFNFETNLSSITVLTNGLAVTNVIPPGGMTFYLVVCPPNADLATNILFSTTGLPLTGPLNVWFNPTNTPFGTIPPDFILLTNSTGGSSIISSTSAPTNFVPGGTYYLGVQNTGTANVTYGIVVDFHLFFPPTPPVIPTQIVDELTLLMVTNTATGLNPPFTYSLLNPPAGMTIDVNGIITWTPDEAQGPNNYLIQVVTTDSGVPPLSSTNSFNVIVVEVNTPPFFLGTPPTQTVAAFATLVVTNAAGDSDIPANPLTYTVTVTNLADNSVVTGATIDNNGIITWTPTLADVFTTNLITTVVTDLNGSAPINQTLSATNQFTVIVGGAPAPFAFTQPATSITGTSAQLNGMATPNGPPTMAWFEWGTSTAYGNRTTPVNVGGSLNVVYVPSSISGLVLHQPYHFRLVVSNAVGVVNGFDQIFDETGVVAWGGDYANQIDVPSGLTNVVAIAAAYDHSLALSNNGTVVAWGDNTKNQTNVPAGLNNVVAVAGGEYYSLALKSDGTVAPWGGNILGQTNVPAGLNNVVNIAGGTFSSLALKSNGRVVAWGANFFNLTNLPASLTNIVAVAGGGFHSLALKNDGTVLVWGDNSVGQRNVPPGLSNVVAIAGGSFHSLALRSDGRVVAWGDDSDGQTNVPPGLSNVVAVAAGGFHSLVLKNDGSVLAWGDNTAFQTNIPVGLSNVVAISSGYFHNLALASAFSINVTNAAPVWVTNNPPPLTMAELTTVLVTNTATDSDLPPQTLTYSLLNPPAWASVDPVSGVITLSPLEADGPGVVTLTNIVTDNGAPPLSATNSFTVTVNEINTPPFWPPGVPSQTNYIINELDALTVTDTALDSDIPANPLTYQLSGPPGAAIDANGIITWTPTLAQGGNTYVFTTIVTDTNAFALVNQSLSATNSFTVVVTTFIGLPGSQPRTNSVAAGSIIYYAVTVPTNADFATNILLFATPGPVNVWFDANNPPTTNLLLLPDVTYPAGTNGSVVLSAATTPPLVPGSVYYLGVLNTNSFPVTWGIEVDFHLTVPPAPPSTNTIVITSITATNSGPTNGYLLQWQGPTNFQYQVQWTTNIAPLVSWKTVQNPVINVILTATNGHYSFFDDGSLTGGFGLVKFYRVLGSLNLLPITGSGPVTNTVLAGALSQAVVTVPAGALWASNVLLSATGPLNVWFNPTNLPTGNTNAGDFLMLSASTAGTFVLTSNSVPPLVPGTNYFLGFQNPGASNVTFVFQVTFSPGSTSALSHFSLNPTNSGMWLKWNGLTNYQYQVQWATNIAPLVAWHTISNVVLTSTTGLFAFYDDGSLTAGFGPRKFYRLIVWPYLTPIPQTLSLSGVTVTNLAGTNDLLLWWSAPTNYHYGVQWTTNLSLPFSSWTSITNPVLTLTNGVYTFIDNGQTGPAASPKFFRLLEY